MTHDIKKVPTEFVPGPLNKWGHPNFTDPINQDMIVLADEASEACPDAILKVTYEGGSDEGYAFHDEINQPLDYDPYTIVSFYFGGFSGSGDGNAYGGTLAFNVKTREVAEVSTFETQIVYSDEEMPEGW